MSYIHRALLKAQKEKDARHPAYRGSLSASVRRRTFFSHRSLWLIPVALILLAFGLYSWLDFEGKNSIATPEPVSAEAQSGPDDLQRAKACYERAKDLHRVGRSAEARRLYQEALVLDPGSVFAMNDLGVLHMQHQDYAEAQTSFENAIKQDPDYVDPHYNLACLHAIRGEKMKSLAHLRKAVFLDRSARKWAREDRDLQNVRGEPGFKDIVGVTE